MVFEDSGAPASERPSDSPTSAIGSAAGPAIACRAGAPRRRRPDQVDVAHRFLGHARPRAPRHLGRRAGTPGRLALRDSNVGLQPRGGSWCRLTTGRHGSMAGTTSPCRSPPTASPLGGPPMLRPFGGLPPRPTGFGPPPCPARRARWLPEPGMPRVGRRPPRRTPSVEAASHRRVRQSVRGEGATAHSPASSVQDPAGCRASATRRASGLMRRTATACAPRTACRTGPSRPCRAPRHPTARRARS